MADTRHDTRQENKSSQKSEESFRQTGEHAAEQTRRIGQAAAKAGDDLSQVSAEFIRHNGEILQNACRFGMEAATIVMNRSADQLGRSFGWTGDEAQRATERSVRNAHTVMESATAVNKGLNEISREYFQFVVRQIETNVARINELWNCRSPYELAAVQSDLVREAMTGALESGRRMADMSQKVAEDAGKRISADIQRAA